MNEPSAAPSRPSWAAPQRLAWAASLAGVTALAAVLRFSDLAAVPRNTFYDAAVRAREQNRLIGRTLPRRAVGSTLLLKGLEADVSIVLNAAEMNARNLYVAMTRGSKALVICSPSPILNPG